MTMTLTVPRMIMSRAAMVTLQPSGGAFGRRNVLLMHVQGVLQIHKSSAQATGSFDGCGHTGP
ncbi:hypothetical protein ACQP1W_34115 [Spirillospora sp. CA-255316]